MSNPPVTPLDLRLDKARILWTHWQRADVVEGYVREFSPDAGHVRISQTPANEDTGRWFRAGDYRCAEVLEQNFDFAAWNEKERTRRQRDNEGDVSGDEWKHA